MTRRQKRDPVKRHMRALADAERAGGIDLDGTATCDALVIKITELLEEHDAMIVVRPTDPRLVGRGRKATKPISMPISVSPPTGAVSAGTGCGARAPRSQARQPSRRACTRCGGTCPAH